MSESQRVISVIAEVLERPVSEIRPEVRFVEDLGVSSLQLVDVVWRLEEVLDLPETPPSKFQRVATVEDMVKLVDETLEQRGKEDEKPEAGERKSRIFDVAFASDHAGVKLKAMLADYLRSRNYLVADLGPQVSMPADYPAFAEEVTSMITDGKARFGVLICGTGIGMSMAANKNKGIRAALVSEPVSAKFARKHNAANVLCFGARTIGPELAVACLDTFLTTAFDAGEDGRHKRRVEMFDTLDK